MYIWEFPSVHVAPIYKMALEELRWEAGSPGSVEKIPMFHADFPGFTSKIVEHSRYLLLDPYKII